MPAGRNWIEVKLRVAAAVRVVDGAVGHSAIRIGVGGHAGAVRTAAVAAGHGMPAVGYVVADSMHGFAAGQRESRGDYCDESDSFHLIPRLYMELQ